MGLIVRCWVCPDCNWTAWYPEVHENVVCIHHRRAEGRNVRCVEYVPASQLEGAVEEIAESGAVSMIQEGNTHPDHPDTVTITATEYERLTSQGAVSREHATQAIGWLSAEVALHGAPELGPEWLELWERALTATEGQ
jgi:hypothetical protein